MRDDVPAWVIHETHSVRTFVDAVRDGETIAEDIPLDAGTLEVTADANVPGRLSLSFPSLWAPTKATDPLAVYGQRLTIRQVLKAGAEEWTVDLGQYLIQAWDHEQPSVDVEALSLEQRIADYRFSTPYRRPGGATFAGQLGAICKGVLPVDTSAMTNRSLPASVTEDWEEDRLGAVRAIQTNWPCDLRVDEDGVLVATPERTVASTPDVEWTHGEANAYVSTGGNGLRDEMFNAVVARGENANGSPVQASAVDDDPSSPTYFYGPFGRRQRFYASPLITTRDEARAAARTVLKRELRRSAQVTVTAPPDPRIEMLDTARVTLDDGQTFTGLVTDISLPLTPLEGAATYTIGIERAG